MRTLPRAAFQNFLLLSLACTLPVLRRASCTSAAWLEPRPNHPEPAPTRLSLGRGEWEGVGASRGGASPPPHSRRGSFEAVCQYFGGIRSTIPLHLRRQLRARYLLDRRFPASAWKLGFPLRRWLLVPPPKMKRKGGEVGGKMTL